MTTRPPQRRRSAWCGIYPALLLVLLFAVAAHTDNPPAPPPFELKDGDRVAFVGDDFFERAQDNGYIETLLTIRFPDRNVRFRNFGWSGDNVQGEARALFGPPADGFNRLKGNLDDYKPTVFFISYGMSESFAGPGKVDEFIAGYEKMLDTFGTDTATANGTPARVVLVSPIQHIDLGPPLPSASEHNKSLRLYAAAISELARRRGCPFVDLYSKPVTQRVIDRRRLPEVTSDGIHLTHYGYWLAAFAFGEQLGCSPIDPSLVIDPAGGKVVQADGAKVADVKAGGNVVLSFTATDANLPMPSVQGLVANQFHGHDGFKARFPSLPAGNYHLASGDGKTLPQPAAFWEKEGDSLRMGESAQSEKLRQEILAKNRDFFNRVRPANDTYIFGFRKKEQGRNAAEMPQFDPLIAAHEEAIAKLRVPRPVTYTLVKE